MNKGSIASHLKRAWHLLDKKFKKKSFFILLGICVNSIFEIIGLAAILPIMAAALKDGFIQENDYLHFAFTTLNFTNERMFILLLCGILFVTFLLKNLFGLLIQKIQFEYCWNIHENISARVMDSAFQKGFLFFNSNNSNKIFNEVAGIPMQFARQTLLQILLLFNEMFVLLLIISTLLVYDGFILVLLAAIILPVFLVFYSNTKQKVAGMSTELNDMIPQINKPIFELAFGYVDVVIGGVFNFFRTKYTSQINDAKALRVRLLLIQNVPNRLIEICVMLAVVIIVVYGIFTIENRSSIVVLISIFGLAAYRTIPSVNRLMAAVLSIKSQEYCLDILESYLSQKNKKPYSPQMNSSIELNRKIKLNSIDFIFPEAKKPLIKGLNFEIKKGTTIGLSGKSGAGKTTLMNLMLGFLQPSAGTISIDDITLDSNNLNGWQKLIGYVRQDVFLIDGSLVENIAFGIPKKEIDLTRVDEAINKAQLNEVVEELDGIHGQIGERGNKLSGGQRQRVGIARALYHGAEVLFFDEATSALDTETEEEITQSIRFLQKEKMTMVIIAHRDTTLRYCDHVYEVSKSGLKEKK